MKRKLEKMNISQKRQKIIPCKVWKAASNFANYFRDDPLIDYLDKYRIYTIGDLSQHLGESSSKSVFRKRPAPSGMFSLLVEKGNNFEKDVFELLKIGGYKYYEFPNNVKEIFKDENYVKTKELLADSTIDIIFHPLLRNYSTQTFGAPDLLIRGRIIKRLVEQVPKNLIDDYFYVVDVKCSKILLDNSGNYLQNSLLYDGYKAQLYIYTSALREMTELSDNHAFVLGQSYECGEDVINYCLYTLGMIDYDTKDYWVVSRMGDAIDWFNRLETEGDSWTLLPPSIPELCPNMNNTCDKNLGPIKKILAERYGEITGLWNCGVEQRKNAFSNGITSLYDPKLTPEILGIIPESKKYIILKRMLDMRNSDKKYIIPQENNSQNWRKTGNDIYIDFETMFNNDEENIVFLIGAVYKKKYYYWHVREPSYEEEGRIWREFLGWLGSIREKIRLVHWGHAEQSTSKRLEKRHEESMEYEKIDLLEVFRDTQYPIILKGVYNFGLKTIVNQLYKLGKVSQNYEGDIQDGGEAMMMAHRYYEKSSVENNLELMEEIIHYNKKDCQILKEILDFIRE